MPHFAREQPRRGWKAGKGQPRNKTPAAQFRSGDVERAETAAATSTNRRRWVDRHQCLRGH